MVQLKLALTTEVCAMLIADLLNRYRIEVLPTKANPLVLSHYLKKMLGDSFASEDLLTIKNSTIAGYRNRRLAESGPRSAKYELQILSAATTIAMSEWDLELKVNPFKVVKKPKQNPGRERRLEPEEWPRLWASLRASKRSPYLLPVVHLAIYTCMRKSEILNTRVQDVSLERKLLRTDGKTGVRHVPLSPEAIMILSKVMDGKLGSEKLFNVTVSQFNQAWTRLRNRAGIYDFTFHDLRHEGISRYMERGDLTPQEVCTISGHKTLSMLWRYTHIKVSTLASRL